MIRAAEEGEVNRGAERTVRAGKFVTFLKSNKLSNDLETAVVLNMPQQQQCLNNAFEAEKHMRALAEASCCQPKGGEHATPEAELVHLNKLHRKAREANAKLLNGEAAMAVDVETAGLLRDLGGPAWQGLRLTDDNKLAACCFARMDLPSSACPCNSEIASGLRKDTGGGERVVDGHNVRFVRVLQSQGARRLYRQVH